MGWIWGDSCSIRPGEAQGQNGQPGTPGWARSRNGCVEPRLAALFAGTTFPAVSPGSPWTRRRWPTRRATD
ncbi:MAG TPA: hypothetical protein VFJ81_02540 [Gemmatimonadales bacterium]|nr:hypothetical protein [Gemmatimonadales bacterium]